MGRDAFADLTGTSRSMESRARAAPPAHAKCRLGNDGWSLFRTRTLGVVLVMSCSPPGAGTAGGPKAAPGTTAGSVCFTVAEQATPLVVDWNSEERAALEFDGHG